MTAPLSGTAVQGPQAINFTAPPSPVTYGTNPIALAATGGGSGNPVMFSVLSGPGSINGNVLTLTGAGTVRVAANQVGDSNYLAAPQVTRTIVVQQAAQAIVAAESVAGHANLRNLTSWSLRRCNPGSKFRRQHVIPWSTILQLRQAVSPAREWCVASLPAF